MITKPSNILFAAFTFLVIAYPLVRLVRLASEIV